jgi:hypothetical protein
VPGPPTQIDYQSIVTLPPATSEVRCQRYCSKKMYCNFKKKPKKQSGISINIHPLTVMAIATTMRCSTRSTAPTSRASSPQPALCRAAQPRTTFRTPQTCAKPPSPRCAGTHMLRRTATTSARADRRRLTRNTYGHVVPTTSVAQKRSLGTTKRSNSATWCGPSNTRSASATDPARTL